MNFAMSEEIEAFRNMVNRCMVNEVVLVMEDFEKRQEFPRELVRKESIFVGSSAGAAAHGARQIAASAPEDSLVVTLFPDSGERYLSKLNRHWMKEKGLIGSDAEF